LAEACDSKREAAKGLVQEFRELIMGSRVIGIGTGTTVSKVIEELKKTDILKGKLAVPSSLDTALKLRGLGVKILLPTSVAEVDVYIDGADEVDKDGNMIKGGGAALLGEKIIASMSKYNIIVVDESKLSERLGRRPIPIEVVPWALAFVLTKLERLGFKARVRTPEGGKMGPVVSDWGGIIIDVTPPQEALTSPKALEQMLKQIPGVVEVGIFSNMADAVVVGMRECGYRVIRFERGK